MNTIKNIMSALSTEYYGKFMVTPERVGLWQAGLDGLPVDIVYSATMQYISEGHPFPPTWGQIRGIAINLRHGELRQVPGPDAWIAVLEQVQGAGGSFRDLPALTRAALKSVGTMYDLKRSENIGFERAHFLKAYAELAEKERIDRVSLPQIKQLAARNAPEPKQLPRPEPAENPRPDYNDPDTRIPTTEEVQAMCQQTIQELSIPAPVARWKDTKGGE